MLSVQNIYYRPKERAEVSGIMKRDHGFTLFLFICLCVIK